MLSLAIQRFPSDWQYGAIVDADFHFTRQDWAAETIHQLQHHGWVQMFSSYTDLDNNHRPVGTNNSFAFNYINNGYKVPGPPYDSYGGRKVGATGGAWAFTRKAYDAVGGLLDRCILGHGDWFMSFGLARAPAPDMRIQGYSREYRDYINGWQQRAAKACNRNIGYVNCHAIHGWHGPKTARGYSTRDKILVDHQFNPHTDVFPDSQGVLQLSPDKPGLRDDIRRYFLSRNEDMPAQ